MIDPAAVEVKPLEVTKDPFPSLRVLTGIRNDAWINPATGLGVSTMDKSVASFFVRDNQLTFQELSDLYHFDDLAIRIVRMAAEEMFRVGYDVLLRETPLPDADDEENEDDPKARKDEADKERDISAALLRSKADKIELDAKMLEAMCLGRAYGGAVLYIGAIDGRSPDQPLDVENIKDIPFLTVFDRREMLVQGWYGDPLAPNYGKPETYWLNPTWMVGMLGTVPSPQMSGIVVHESRLIRFEGTHADRRERVALWGWTYSVLQPVYDVIRSYQNLMRSMGYMVQDANQSVFKLSGLAEQISQNAAELAKRMQFVEQTRAVNRAVLLDVDDGEDFQKIPTTFSGVPDIYDRFERRFALAADTPVSLLFGPPLGAGTNSEADMQAWYNKVGRDRERDLVPKVLAVYKLLARVLGIDPDSVIVSPRPLAEMSESERADLELKHAQKDRLYVDSGVLLPEEVALSRFREPDEFNLRISLDEESIDARHESLKLALEEPDFSGAMEALPGGSGLSMQPGQKGKDTRSGPPTERGSVGTSGPPRSNTRT